MFLATVAPSAAIAFQDERCAGTVEPQNARTGHEADSSGQLRGFLQATSVALSGIGQLFGTLVHEERLGPVERYEAFFAVLDRDARDALAAVQLVLAQPSISSQLIDNLNASIHLRALLTDLFLIDEILKPQKTVQIRKS